MLTIWDSTKWGKQLDENIHFSNINTDEILFRIKNHNYRPIRKSWKNDYLKRTISFG